MEKKIVTLALIAIAVFLAISCSTTRTVRSAAPEPSLRPAETEIITVASHRANCMGVAPMQCLLIRRTGQPDWEFFYAPIEGFLYNPGYEYVLLVSKHPVNNPAADSSSVSYELEKVISIEKKDSDNLPESAIRE